MLEVTGFSFCGSGMIGGKRRSLLKQLWRQHQELNPSPSTTGTSNNSSATPHARDRTVTAKAAIKALSKRLKDRQLEALVQVLDGSSSCSPLNCVLVPRADVHLPEGKRLAPHVIACQLWRWPTVEDARRLRVLPICSTASYSSSSTYSFSRSPSVSSAQPGSDVQLCCCNPFHWSTTIPDESPSSAPLSEFGRDHSDKVSFDSDDDEKSRQWQTPWCHLVYREYKHHIGGYFSIYSEWTRVFQDLFHHGDGMCLSLIQKPTTSRAVDRTRSKIGGGILLSRQKDCVWMFNCSEHPVFVCSPSFFSGMVHGQGTFAVRRIPPGCSLKVYDCALVDRLLSLASSSEDVVAAATEGPVYLDSIHVSFVKGWGKQYTRLFITSCPCWMEILLRRK